MIFPSISSLLLLALLHSVAVNALPVNLTLLSGQGAGMLDNVNADNAMHELQPRQLDFNKPRILLGYLAVPKDAAEELNKYGFTAYPLNRFSTPLGTDGTYVDAKVIPDDLLPHSFWKCAIFIDTLEMAQTLRGYIDDQGPVYNYPGRLPSFIGHLQERWKMAGKHFVIGPPLLATKAQKDWHQLVVLVPYEYLLKSPTHPDKPSGKNHLDLRIKCTPKGTALHIDFPSPEWEYWGFEYWPKGLKI